MVGDDAMDNGGGRVVRGAKLDDGNGLRAALKLLGRGRKLRAALKLLGRGRKLRPAAEPSGSDEAFCCDNGGTDKTGRWEAPALSLPSIYQDGRWNRGAVSGNRWGIKRFAMMTSEDFGITMH